jgi:3D (Asp-Asp-Asp) domain-containing protein
MKRRKPQFEWLFHQIAIFSLLLRKLRVQVVLASWVVPDRIGRVLQRLRSEFRVGRALLAVAVCAVIVAPSYMLMQERERRAEMDRAYTRLSIRSGTEINTLSTTLQTLLDEQNQLRSLLLDAGYAVVSGDRLWVRLLATGYSSTVRETDDTPFITASNTRTRPGVVALSRDLLSAYNSDALFSFGDAIHISGLGDFSVEDSMHWRWRRRVDIWFPETHGAWQFGKRRVTVSMPLFPLTGLESAPAEIVVDQNAATSYASTTNPDLPE